MNSESIDFLTAHMLSVFFFYIINIGIVYALTRAYFKLTGQRG